MHHEIDRGDLLAITSVEITPDLSLAKVFFSFIGDQKAKEHACHQLNQISHQIARLAMKKVRLRIFPRLTFYLDEGLEKQMRIADILAQVLPDEDTKPS